MANGFFLGGAAEGINKAAEGIRADIRSRREENLGQRKLDIAQAQLQLENDRELRKIGLGQIEAFRKHLESIAKTGNLAAFDRVTAAMGTPLQGSGGASTVQNLQAVSDKLGLGVNIQSEVARIRAGISTPEETGVLKGGQALAEAEGGGAKAAALTTTATEKAKVNVNPPAADVLNFRMPDGKLRAVNARDTKAVRDAIAEGGVKISLGVQAQTLEGLALAGETKQSLPKLREAIQGTQADIEELGKTLEGFRKLPEAGGFMGTLIEKGGGVVQQLESIAGVKVLPESVKPEEITKVRTQARVTVSNMLTAVTKETTRFTDEERRRAEQALQTLVPEASQQQITAALQTAISIMERGQTRNLDRLRIEAKADLSTDAGIEAFGDVLLKNGFTREQAIKAIIRLQDRLGIGPMK